MGPSARSVVQLSPSLGLLAVQATPLPAATDCAANPAPVDVALAQSPQTCSPLEEAVHAAVAAAQIATSTGVVSSARIAPTSASSTASAPSLSASAPSLSSQSSTAREPIVRGGQTQTLLSLGGDGAIVEVACKRDDVEGCDSTEVSSAVVDDCLLASAPVCITTTSSVDSAKSSSKMDAAASEKEVLMIMSTLERELSRTRKPCTAQTVATAPSPCLRPSAERWAPRRLGPERTTVRGGGLQRRLTPSCPHASSRRADPIAESGSAMATRHMSHVPSRLVARNRSGASSVPTPLPPRCLGSSASALPAHAQAHSGGGCAVLKRPQQPCVWSLADDALQAPQVRDDRRRVKGGEKAELNAESVELRAASARLRRELSDVESVVALETQRLQDAQAERDLQIRNSEAVEEFLVMMREQLQETSAKSAALEAQLVSVLVSSRARAAEAAKASSRHDTNAGMSIEHDDGAFREVGASAVEATAASTAAVLQDDAAAVAAAAGLSGRPKEALVCSSPLPLDAPSSELVQVPVEQDNETAEQEAAASGAIDDQSQDQHPWEFVVQGQLDDDRESADFADKAVNCFPGDALERLNARGIAFACVRGDCNRGASFDDGCRSSVAAPNQDDFVLALSAPGQDSHVSLYGVFDGYGSKGHECAAFVRGKLPECIFGDTDLFSRPEAALRRAFRHTLRALLREPFFHGSTSGTAATVVLVLASHATEPLAFVAHLGTSRVLLVSGPDAAEGASSSSFSTMPLTSEDRSAHQTTPGVASTLRSLGGPEAAERGAAAAEPELSSWRLRPNVDLLLVLGTDGLFEHMDDDLDVVAPLMQRGISTGVLQELCEEAKRRGVVGSQRAAANSAADDATIIVITLKSHFTSRHKSKQN